MHNKNAARRLRTVMLCVALASQATVLLNVGQAAASEEEARAQQARASKCAQPYPLEAQRSGVTGTTKVRISVDAEGNAIDVVVINSSGSSREHRQLDRAAVALFKCIGRYKKTGEPYAFESAYAWKLE